MNKIVQCVPNISEGRDHAKIQAILAPLMNQPNVKLISAEPDKDYNRTVITLLGDPEAMIEPLLAFFGEAIQAIDMNVHRGEHPRMGAVDVCPFIPISGITIEECVDVANRLAKLVSSKFHLPVFLYAKAAQSPNRVNLPDIRKGEYEGMISKIAEPEWAPDYGEPKTHPTAGVVAIGARIPLVAFNVDLATMDEKIANNIAKAIRQSSGGYQYIQAGPATLVERGHVQVTMNILDYKKNPIYRILETVKMEARRYRVAVPTAEIIGAASRSARRFGEVLSSSRSQKRTQRVAFGRPRFRSDSDDGLARLYHSKNH
ncbi:MAG: glutamate formimidoyltransferase [Bacillus subtilis]|nr:glutamate formimidoyltransferase [Bacillus subtilis]